jgi:hypothetical protein
MLAVTSAGSVRVSTATTRPEKSTPTACTRWALNSTPANHPASERVFRIRRGRPIGPWLMPDSSNNRSAIKRSTYWPVVEGEMPNSLASVVLEVARPLRTCKTAAPSTSRWKIGFLRTCGTRTITFSHRPERFPLPGKESSKTRCLVLNQENTHHSLKTRCLSTIHHARRRNVTPD